MNLNYSPHISVGPISFGMDRAHVRAALGVEPIEFMKTYFAPAPTDDFRSLGLHVFYDAGLTCVGVEVFPPSNILVEGRRVVGQPYSEVMEWLIVLDPGVVLIDSVVRSKALGLSLYAPDADEDSDSKIESVFLSCDRG